MSRVATSSAPDGLIPTRLFVTAHGAISSPLGTPTKSIDSEARAQTHSTLRRHKLQDSNGGVSCPMKPKLPNLSIKGVCLISSVPPSFDETAMACGLSKHAFVPSTRHYGVGAYAEGIWYQIHGDNDVGIDHNGSARFLRKDICVTCRNSSFFVPMHVVLCNWNAVHF